jgi:hypothetical protein
MKEGKVMRGREKIIYSVRLQGLRLLVLSMKVL